MGNLRRKTDPEREIRDSIRSMLEARGWLVALFHNDKYQTGIPDLWAHHPRYGFRWIDAKNPGRYAFTNKQLVLWPIWEEKQVGIWIMVGSSQEEYNKLFQPPNWRSYLRPFEIRRMESFRRDSIDEQLALLRQNL